MPEENPKLTIDFKKWGIVLGVVVSLISVTGFGVSSFQGYHDQFAKAEELDNQITDLNVEIITLAIQAKEDELSLIEYKQATGQATDLDTANKANIERRLNDLKNKLDDLGE